MEVKSMAVPLAAPWYKKTGQQMDLAAPTFGDT